MIIEINIDIKKDKYDYNGIAKTNIIIDSDIIDEASLTQIAADLTQSAIDRANAKLTPIEPASIESSPIDLSA